MKILTSFNAFRNPVFLKLYLAQTISMLGDAFTWLGLALLVYELDPANAPKILASALTLRVAAYIIFGPFAGVVAERFNQKHILVVTHFIRMAIVCLLPFVSATWQIYSIMFFLNVFNAFYTPTFQAVIPRITNGHYYRESIGVAVATNQILGILGPAVAGVVTLWLPVKDIFFVDGVSFVFSGVLILMIPAKDLNVKISRVDADVRSAWKDVLFGVKLLFGNRIIRFALLIEFVSALAGAMILVNSIGLVKTELHLDDRHYGWLMAALATGAALSAFVFGALDKSKSRSKCLIFGALLLAVTISFANYVGFEVLLGLWVIAGVGQSLADMPAETLIGENIAENDQGKVYGSHFAFSHLWWAMAYPIAGYLGTNYAHKDFLIGGVLSLVFLGVFLVFRVKAAAGGE